MIALPTDPVTEGDTGSGALTTGIEVGTIVNVNANWVLAPSALLALKLVVETPLTVGEPEIAPVPVFRLRPAGKTLAPTIA